MKTLAVPTLSLAVAMLAACGGGGSDRSGGMMTGPGPMGGSSTLMSVTPAGGAVGVSASASMVMTFGAAMAPGMEQYVDLHVGYLSGPTVPMSCGWSADRLTLTCAPLGALAPHTTYVLHLGGGMMSQAGQYADYAQRGPGMGGQWVAGGMMGSTHGGSPWSMMGNGWRDPNGSYGMAFAFTTA